VSDTATTVVVPMPHMGVSVEEGTVIEWLKEVGDEVAAEEPICAIATDKVDTEVLAPADGVLTKIVAGVEETVAVGEPIGEMEVGADASSLISDNVPSDAPAGEEGADPGVAVRAAAGRDEVGRFDPKAAAEAVLSFAPRGSGSTTPALASPVAKRIAAEHGLDLGAIQGTGRRGRVRKSDVLQAISSSGAGVAPPAKAPAPPSTSGPALGPGGVPPGYEGVPHEVVPTTRVRQVIAEHMVRSRQTAAHMTTEVDVDLSAVVHARTELNAARREAGAPKLSYLPFIARATCVALGEHPRMNATFLGDRAIHWGVVNLGVAVDTPEGLLVPVIKDCDRLTAPAISDALVDLAERARTRKLTPDDLAGGTFTLSNPGSVGAVSAPAIINQPQIAILGVPTIQRRPWAVTDDRGQEAIAIRPILRLAITFDHRHVDGADATRFAVSIKDSLESWSPEAYT
jgi:pyruvate/2-oxoglutarate dehydrogenase complex dihydrolipoamide acyltransferase (E2) component